MNWYGVLKVLHVLSAVAWIGGGAAFSTVTARLVRATDRATLKAMLPQVTGYMQTMAGPASGLVLLSGIAMVIVGKVGFRTLWVDLGFLGFVLHGLFGGLVMRKRMAALESAVTATADDALALAGARLRSANIAYLTIMAAVIAIMVLKPTL
ncbi:MAG TPA: DUF2269 family protein [Gemmatimonadaceae bacterium]